jgi:hypothetical protein
MAGGEHKGQGIGGDSVFHTRTVNGREAAMGDFGSKLAPTPAASRPKWAAGLTIGLAPTLWG